MTHPGSSDDLPLGTPPSYSTTTTLALALLTIAASLVHGALGTFDYPLSWPGGVVYILLAGLLLVYGVLLLIRYAEARDAMSDPLPRTAMYATRHERMNHLTGVGLHAAALLVACIWMALRHGSLVHLAGVLLSLWAVGLVQRSHRRQTKA